MVRVACIHSLWILGVWLYVIFSAAASRGRDAKASFGAVPTWVSERCLWCHSARSLGWDLQKQGERIPSASSTDVLQRCIYWHVAFVEHMTDFNFLPIPPLLPHSKSVRWWATAMAWSLKDSNTAMSASVWSTAQSRWIHLRWLPVRPSPRYRFAIPKAAETARIGPFSWCKLGMCKCIYL